MFFVNNSTATYLDYNPTTFYLEGLKNHLCVYCVRPFIRHLCFLMFVVCNFSKDKAYATKVHVIRRGAPRLV